MDFMGRQPQDHPRPDPISRATAGAGDLRHGSSDDTLQAMRGGASMPWACREACRGYPHGKENDDSPVG